MEERDILEDIYIDNTISMWGGKMEKFVLSWRMEDYLPLMLTI